MYLIVQGGNCRRNEIKCYQIWRYLVPQKRATNTTCALFLFLCAACLTRDIISTQFVAHFCAYAPRKYTFPQTPPLPAYLHRSSDDGARCIHGGSHRKQDANQHQTHTHTRERFRFFLIRCFRCYSPDFTTRAPTTSTPFGTSAAGVLLESNRVVEKCTTRRSTVHGGEEKQTQHRGTHRSAGGKSEREREGERTSGGNTFAQNAHDSRTLLADLAAESRLRNRAFIVHGRVGFLAIANFDAGYFILEAKSCSLCFSSLAPRYIDNWRLIQFPAGRAGFDSQLLL